MQQFEVTLRSSYPDTKTPAVSFDLERISLDGSYTDQLSAYRAKKQWIETFESNFLLEHDHDFKVRVASDLEARKFVLRCEFLTACGRYAFWRLSHNQAPEVQFIVENAHLPGGFDVDAISEEETEHLSQVLGQYEYLSTRDRLTWRQWLRKIISGLQG